MTTSPYTRICTQCEDEKPLAQYRGPSSRCNACVSAAGRRKRSSPAAKRVARDRRYRRLYGITLADFERIARRQRWRCRICDRRAYPAGTPLVPDHNHATGEVRALLCMTCNAALGLLGEKPDRVLSALLYLLAHGDYRDLHM